MTRDAAKHELKVPALVREKKNCKKLKITVQSQEMQTHRDAEVGILEWNWIGQIISRRYV